MQPRILFLFAIVLLFQSAISHGVKEDEEDDNTFELMVDVINFFLFVFAGGPEEVFVRIMFLVCAVLVILLGTAMCGLCCGTTHRSIRSKRSSFDKSIDWGCRVFTSLSIGSEFYKNSSRWGID